MSTVPGGVWESMHKSNIFHICRLRSCTLFFNSTVFLRELMIKFKSELASILLNRLTVRSSAQERLDCSARIVACSVLSLRTSTLYVHVYIGDIYLQTIDLSLCVLYAHINHCVRSLEISVHERCVHVYLLLHV